MFVGFNSVPNPVIDISLLLPLLSLAMAVELRHAVLFPGVLEVKMTCPGSLNSKWQYPRK